MSQLPAIGLIALGLCIFATVIFLAFKEKNTQIAASSKPEQHTTASTAQARVPPTGQQPEFEAVVSKDVQQTSLVEDKYVHLLRDGELLPAWWYEQFQSLTEQVQLLREHAKDVERQIAILSEIAPLAAELETLQRKHDVLPEGKIALFPLKVHRQPTDTSYMTDKRPVVRKYTIEAMS